MKMIWATRGRDWGLRFLRDGGLHDPLPVYERMFPPDALEPAPLRRVGRRLALRLTDPEGRRDRSGRPIVHEFIVDGTLAKQIMTVDDGRRLVWPLVADDYARIWDRPAPG